jgi:hypothetical protein
MQAHSNGRFVILQVIFACNIGSFGGWSGLHQYQKNKAGVKRLDFN